MTLAEGKTFFQFTDFRELLKVEIDKRKEAGKPFSFRWFSQKAGYSSPNFLKLIIEGKRNLTEEGIDRVSQVFAFSAKQRSFFRILVHLNQAKTAEHREALVKDLLNLLGRGGETLLQLSQYNYYNRWYYIPLRELIGAEGAVLTIPMMASRLQPNLTQAQVEEALASMETLGLIQKKGSGYQVTDQMITTGNEVSALAVKHYHLNMLRLAGESIDRFSREEREISSVTLSLTPEKAAEAKKMIQEFRKKLWSLETNEQGKEIYQINFQLFPLTASKRGRR